MTEVKITKDDYQRWLNQERFALRLLNIGLRSWLTEELTQLTSKLKATHIVGQEGEILSYRSVYGSILDDLEGIVEKVRHELDDRYNDIARYEKKIREMELAEAEEFKKQEIQRQADIAGVKITRLGPSTNESDGAEAERRELNTADMVLTVSGDPNGLKAEYHPELWTEPEDNDETDS